jgi:hypothetical protein
MNIFILQCCCKTSFWNARGEWGISAWWGRAVDGDGTGFEHGKGSRWTLFAWIYARFGLGRAGRSASGEGPLRSAVEARGTRNARDVEASSARSASASRAALSAPPARSLLLEHRCACSACSQLHPQVVEGAEMVAELRTRATVLKEQAALPVPTWSASGRRCARRLRAWWSGEAATHAAVEARARGDAAARSTGRQCGASWRARMWAQRGFARWRRSGSPDAAQAEKKQQQIICRICRIICRLCRIICRICRMICRICRINAEYAE